MIYTLFFPYDVYSRHKLIAKLIGNNCAAVLDVGGSLKQLKTFLPANTTLFTTDIIGGDVIFNGKDLPIKDNSVETVVSIDTIEHLPKSSRGIFIKELARVSKHELIIAAPLGTDSHIKAEKAELTKQKTAGRKPDKYLSEHVKHGLPCLTDIKVWLKDFPEHSLIFSGNFSRAHWLFRLHQSEILLPKLGRIWYELKKLIFAIINLGLYPLEKEVSLSQEVNRFYLRIRLS